MTPRLHRTVTEFRAACDEIRHRGGRLGIVPTMGALHEGHLALVREARSRATDVAVTIFVNPTQFGASEDLEKYPRDLEGDLAKCASAGATLVFAPAASEMYSENERTRVRVSALTDALCGPSRPGHFEGVATIVTKLFAIAGPCVAVFGRKDYQQLAVITRMTRDLLMPAEIVGHPIVREPDGLAMSSRNVFLDAGERQRALAIPRGLSNALALYSGGERRVGALVSAARGPIEAAGLRTDYVTLADADEITPFADDARVGERALLAVAAHAGSTRLIDNVVLGEDKSCR